MPVDDETLPMMLKVDFKLRIDLVMLPAMKKIHYDFCPILV
jgi:hypothetical protein